MTTNAETAALLKILELGARQVAEGRVHDARDAISELRRKYCPQPGSEDWPHR